MIRCILVDLAILVSCLYALFLTFRMNKKKRYIFRQCPRISNGLFGLFCGASGVFLSLFPISVNGTVFSLGCIFLMFAGIFGGAVPLAACSAVLILIMILMHGLSIVTALGTVSILLMAAVTIPASRLRLSDRVKWFLCSVCFLPATLPGFLPSEKTLLTFAFFASCKNHNSVGLPVIPIRSNRATP